MTLNRDFFDRVRLGLRWRLNLVKEKTSGIWRGISDLADFFVRFKIRVLTHLLKTNRGRLLIFDDTFHWIGSNFRIVEINAYLAHFPRSLVYTTTPDFFRKRRQYAQLYGWKMANRTFRYDPKAEYSGSFAFIIFLHNAHAFLPVLERCRVPFLMEMYPGGFFCLNNERSDAWLRLVCSSPMFRGVIVTTRISKQYLMEKKFCDEDKIHYMYGGVAGLPELRRQRAQYPEDKRTFDICFIAYQQTPRGEDKGYDVFIAAAKILAKLSPIFRFHVVGTFSERVIDVSEIWDRITFYGPQTRAFFETFHADMDAIVSPCRPFVLEPGAFDGIPTGCTGEAGACGVAMFTTDVLRLTEGIFHDGKDIVLIQPDPNDVVEKMMFYFQNPDLLRRIALGGRETIRRVLANELQVAFRVEMIEKLMKQG